jgi:ribonuclease HII
METVTNKYGLKMFNNSEHIEVGLDECARGCLFGRTYMAAVIWNNEFDGLDDKEFNMIRDSKKLSKVQREDLVEYIESNAIDYYIYYADAKEIDQYNILQAVQNGFHKCLDELQVKPDHLYVEGNYFKTYQDIPHTTVIKGDNTYINIACASILAKVYHDRYIEELCDQNPEYEKYGIRHNMGYGTADHIQAIKEYGYSDQHRKSFQIKSLYKKECMIIEDA